MTSRNIWRFRGDADLTKAQDSYLTPDFIKAADDSPLLARLLYNRGLKTAEEARAFLNLEDYKPGSGWELPDMKQAVERILKAIETQEHILVYGDFDVDGITGTSVLMETLKRLQANVSFYIPDRATEGHGLNTAALIRLTSSRKVKLVITTDTGITNFAEVSLLNGLKVDTVITDHHALPENLPPAVANINSQRLFQIDPNHPMGHLCGAGVAYKLSELLVEALLPPEEAQVFAESLLDIVAVGTVVDMVPLIGENRYLVYRGLKVLNKRQRLGFREILEQAGTKPESVITSETLGFTIGPRLNALGRLEKADQGVELITTTDPERARIIGAHLEFLNRRRRELCDQTYLEAESHLQRGGGLGDQRAIILGSPDWNPGIIGIVASRLIEKYHVPVFMMVIDDNKGEARCSGRSIPGFHLHDELCVLSDYFLGFGGHGGAGGFALKIERLENFKRDLHALCSRVVTDEHMRPIIEVDAKLEWPQINPHLVALVNKMAPFGMNNPSPKFVIENATVAAQRGLGDGERHLKLVLTSKAHKDAPIEGLLWNFGNKERFDARYPYNFVVVPELNTFNGSTKVQLIIEDYMSPVAARHASETQTEAPAAAGPVAAIPGNPAAARAFPVHHATTGNGTFEVQHAAEPAQTGPQWIDHRSRDGLESFIGQLMLPLQDRRKVLVFHEGRKPEIPFLDEKVLCHRLNAKEADELILWDFPPSMAEFRELIGRVRPEVIHMVGGKYQSVPVFPSEQQYLKIILQSLKKLAAEQTESAFEINSLAAQLATTSSVLVHGLILLERMGLVETRLSGGASSGAAQKATFRLLSQNMAADFNDRLEYFTYQTALRDVGKFRNWLLSAPLDTIRASATAEAAPSSEGSLSTPAKTPGSPQTATV